LAIMLDMNGTLVSPERIYQRLAGYRQHYNANGKFVRSLRKLHLIVQYYQSASNDRQPELFNCLKANILNLGIDQIHVLTEKNLNRRIAGDLRLFSNLSAEVSSVQGRFTVYEIGQRLTFAAAFEYINSNIQSGDIAIVANADISFDETLNVLKYGKVETLKEGNGIAIRPLVDMSNRVFALLRWDVHQGLKRRFLTYHPRTDCQDSWVFQVPLPPMPDECDFVLGRLRCGNRIAQIFEDAGLHVSNPSLSIISHHLQNDPTRQYTNADSVPGKFRFVELSDILMGITP